jgi:hypothetical protein
MWRRALGAAVVAVVLAGVHVPAGEAVGPSGCPATMSPGALASEATFEEWNRVLADLGPRPTASPSHEQYIRWIEKRLGAIPGIELSALHDEVDRQLETSAGLTLHTAWGDVRLPVAGPVPYSAAAPAGTTARVVAVPAGTAIADVQDQVAGAVVVRPAASGLIPMAVFGAVAYYVHDPALSFDYAGNYESDWVGAGQRVTDLQQAQAAGAAGIVFVHELPRHQVEGQYVPYTGDFWAIPAIYLGSDEGAALTDALASAGGELDATMKVAASRRHAPTRTVIGRLPGTGPLEAERIVIESHTDGMNAVWDNGPVALLALAEVFAALEPACRPRTLEFVFTTAHLYLTHSGAELYAAMLDEEYDAGTVALVVALEHLGAREFEARPRVDGGPGRELAPTGESELFATFTLESPALVGALTETVVRHDLRRTWVLRGADAPQLGFPPHRSFGGEGGPYRAHLVPTVAAITGPWTLFDPAFSMHELVDFELMRRQTLAFGDLVLALDNVPREVIAGADNVYRQGRDLTE